MASCLVGKPRKRRGRLRGLSPLTLWTYSRPVAKEGRMEQRTLGSQGLRVSAIGLGCMVMSKSYWPADEQESVATIQRARELGITLLDTADMYEPFTNERLVVRAIAGHRD